MTVNGTAVTLPVTPGAAATACSATSNTVVLTAS